LVQNFNLLSFKKPTSHSLTWRNS